MQNISLESFSSLQKRYFNVNYNFIIVIPEKRWYLLLTFFSQVIVLKVFLKILPYTTVEIRGLHLWYNSSNIRYRFCNKRFKVFLEPQMPKDKRTYLLAVKMWNFYTILMPRPLIFLYIVIFFSTVFTV